MGSFNIYPSFTCVCLQKPDQNSLSKTSRSTYLNNGTVVANNREGELFSFGVYGNSIHVTS